ncbi:hypothetical protein FSARC_5683 [Fusarium sarcochroum]|uniref:Cutinase n=1 Tax=Fusarium sarcochroum TaxID=1208366 RepID=A0A8H4XA55_9HYPO|nr:hypothetical protein FSARC_5683 [Fusarium sarcochroum]
MLSKSIILSLASVAVAGPIAPRQLSGFPGLGGGSSSFPGLGGGSSGGIPSIPSGGSSGGLPSIPSIPSGGSSGSLPSGLPGLGGGSSSFPGLGGGSSGGIPSIPSGGSTTGGDTTEEDSSSSTPSLPSGGSSNTPSFLGSTGTGSGSGFSGSTQNGLSGECKDVTIIFARGTSEMGNVGSAAGPPFFQALADQIGNDKLAVQGVEYSASAAGIAQMGDKAGSEKMASLVKQAYQKCPKTKVVMSGYSQGAMLVHNAAKSLPAETTKNIAAVVNFGDPFQKQAVQGVPTDRVKIICHSGDGVCAGTAAITPDHLTYSQDAKAAASFVASKVGK